MSIRVISSFGIRSQRPSLAITTILSILGWRFGKDFISGSCVTPTVLATKSPRDLVIARPGACLFFNQTLFGPKNYGLIFPWGTILDCSILPLDFLILLASSFSSGLWSLLSEVHCHIPTELLEHMIALLSPLFAQTIVLLCMSTTTTVVPLNIESILFVSFWCSIRS